MTILHWQQQLLMRWSSERNPNGMGIYLPCQSRENSPLCCGQMIYWTAFVIAICTMRFSRTNGATPTIGRRTSCRCCRMHSAQQPAAACPWRRSFAPCHLQGPVPSSSIAITAKPWCRSRTCSTTRWPSSQQTPKSREPPMTARTTARAAAMGTAQAVATIAPTRTVTRTWRRATARRVRRSARWTWRSGPTRAATGCRWSRSAPSPAAARCAPPPASPPPPARRRRAGGHRRV
jgi:hypothetical protein